MYFAHSRNTRGQRHDLVAHLRSVAARAAGFAAEFGAADAARWLGLWHDLGKFDQQFQQYLLTSEANPALRGHGPDHKAAGTQLATRHLGRLALLIQGHHGGLHTPNEMRTWLTERARDPAVAEALQRARQVLPDLEPSAPPAVPSYAQKDPWAGEFFLRLLFAALVDADHLDTEEHGSPEKTALRGSTIPMATLWARFAANQERLTRQGTGPVDPVRQAIYAECLATAEHPPGLFRLAVPTGGGKTRSALAFALRHALRHGHKRIIVAVPFISITEQTADVYRDIFAPGADPETPPIVLEHHSGGYAEADSDDDFQPDKVWQRLGAENWDAPIIVTTTVQLFQSLFANGPSRCRKLHRLARSVVILDEAQALPARLLAPILDALQQLCTHYGTTVVISTATQPAFDTIPVFANIRATDIVAEPARYFRQLKRVDYEWRTDRPYSWPEVAQWLAGEPQALAILNTKKDALTLLDVLADADALHLSSLLCGAHRRRVIAEVAKRLAAGERCRLISTQVIEAGVDLDFPLVIRALGPLDAIIQAAGRCNRHGRLALGRTMVFDPADGGMPRGAYKIGANLTRAFAGRGELDPDDPATARRYFQQLFATLDPDEEGIQELRKAHNYPEVARRFRMIDDDTESVAVAYGSPKEQQQVADLLDRLRRGAPDSRLILRRLQPYLVSVRARQAQKYRRDHLIEPIMSGLGIWRGEYHPVRGLTGGDLDLETLVV